MPSLEFGILDWRVRAMKESAVFTSMSRFAGRRGMRSGRVGSLGRLAAASVLGTALLVGSSGCNNALEGGLSGAGFGALAGLGIGSLSGNAGAGAAIGAIAGGLGGAVLGDQNQRSRSRWGGHSSRCD